jgi:predicted transcriptional regulator
MTALSESPDGKCVSGRAVDLAGRTMGGGRDCCADSGESSREAKAFRMNTGSTQRQPMIETRHQTKLLALLRDEGPLSRVELGERLELPRARVAAEVTRLGEFGLADQGVPTERESARS